MGRNYRSRVDAFDYEKQPLPLVGVWSNYNNNPELGIYDSTLNLVARTATTCVGVASKGSDYTWPTQHEIWNGIAGQLQTHGQMSSSGYGNHWVASTAAMQADGHQILAVSPHGHFSAKDGSVIGALMQYWGVVLGPEGYRQSMSLYANNYQIAQYLRGTPVRTDYADIRGAEFCEWGTVTNLYGQIGYDFATDTLVLLASKDNNCNYRLHIWKNPGVKLTGRAGELQAFMKQARAGLMGASYAYKDFAWSTSSSSGSNEARHHLKVIPCRNGQVALVRMIPSSRTEMAVVNPVTGAVKSDFTTNSLTTSYGIDQGAQYGMRHQMSWDNKWMACFCPYYYYGSGISGFFVNIDDPARYFRMQHTNTSNGISLAPLGESGFAFSFNFNNADGNKGHSLGMVSLGELQTVGGGQMLCLIMALQSTSQPTQGSLTAVTQAATIPALCPWKTGTFRGCGHERAACFFSY